MKMKSTKISIIAIIFIAFIISILVLTFVGMFISKNKGIITLNSSNIVEQLESNRTFSQYFKIEKDSYEVYKHFYTGHSTSSDELYTNYDDNYFIIRINGEYNEGYYMAVHIKTETNKESSILSALENGESITLTGMISKISASYGSTKVIDEFHSALGTDKSNVLDYCININL